MAMTGSGVGMTRPGMAMTGSDAYVIEIPYGGCAFNPRAHFFQVTPLGSPIEVSLVLLPAVPAFHNDDVVGVVLALVDRQPVATVGPASMMKLIA